MIVTIKNYIFTNSLVKYWNNVQSFWCFLILAEVK